MSNKWIAIISAGLTFVIADFSLWAYTYNWQIHPFWMWQLFFAGLCSLIVSVCAAVDGM